MRGGGRVENISCSKSAKKRVLMPKVKNVKGDTITSRKGIANVFGELDSKLHAGNETEERLQNTLKDTRAHDEEKW